ncbi:MAG: DUF1016 N-terminal domain-containing protein [Nitrosopumilus sp.]
MNKSLTKSNNPKLLNRIGEILTEARRYTVHTVNTILVKTYWEIGKEIVEHELGGKTRAEYGKEFLKNLSRDLTVQYGKGFSYPNLRRMCQFYNEYEILSTVSREFKNEKNFIQYNSVKLLLLSLVLIFSACSSSKLTVSPTNGEYDFVSEKSVEYETFWEAIENLDFDYLSEKTLNDDQQQFYEALSSVVDGDIDTAVTQFQNLYNNSTDSLIQKHSEEIISKLYFLQSNWEKILELDKKSNNNLELENDIILFEAFSKSPKESFLFPSQPTIIPMDPVFFGSNPMIEVIVNGHKKKFWIDTGAGLSVVSSDVAEECNIFPIGTEKTTAGTGTNKRVSIQPAIIENLQIGELLIKNHPVVIVDKSDLEFKLFGLLRILKIDGIIGWPAIQNMKIEIDYKNKRTIIEKPIKIETTDRNFFWLGFPIVKLKTPDGKNLNFGLDTGANKTSIHKNILKKINIENGYDKKITHWSAGGFEKTETKIVPNLSFILNGNVLHFKVIRISLQKGIVFVKSDGQLGIDIAQDRSIIIDYQNGRFELH